MDASLAFYPGAQPLRAVIAERHGPAVTRPPSGTTIGAMLHEYATALSHDPWLARWPAVLAGVRPGQGSHLIDGDGDAVPSLATDPWRLLAVSGGGR